MFIRVSNQARTARARHLFAARPSIPTAPFASRDNHDHPRNELNRPAPETIRSNNQTRKYNHDPEVNQIMRSKAEHQNSIDRDVYNSIVLNAAAGLHKLYKSKGKQVREHTEHVIK